jgi:purine catabolism regulator
MPPLSPPAPPTLRAVADLPGLGLRRLAGPDGRDRPVTWVAVSELEDPRPFLEGGELLLTTGMRLSDADGPGLREYVGRLVEAEVAGLGVGIGLTHDVVPPALVRAAADAGLPLLEVPDRTPFIAVAKAVSALLAAAEYEATVRAFQTQRELTRVALGEGAAGVVARLARYLDGWVVLLDEEGAVLHATPAPAADRAPGLAAEVAELGRRGLLASSALAGAGEHVSVQPLGARGRVRGFLAMGTAVPLDRTAQAVAGVAVSLLSLALERADLPEVAGGLRAAALRLLLAGARPSDLPMEALGWSALTGGTLRVVVATGPADEPRSLVERLGRGAAADVLDGELVVVVADDDTVLSGLEAALAATPAGGSAAVSLPQLAIGLTQARQALAAARTPGLHWYGQIAEEGMLAALDPTVARGVADALLAPLQGRKGDLVGSVRAWLAHNGQWDVAAAELDVHRHTLRHRLRRVEQLLGRSLDDPDLRAELWLALKVYPDS